MSERSLNTSQTKSSMETQGAESEKKCSVCNTRADRLWGSKCTLCFSRGGVGTSSSTPLTIKINKTSAAAASSTSKTTTPTTSRPAELKRNKASGGSSACTPLTIKINKTSAAAAASSTSKTTTPTASRPAELESNKTSGGSSSSTPIIIRSHKTRAASATSSTPSKTTTTATSRPPEIKRRKLFYSSPSCQQQTPPMSSSPSGAMKLVRLSPGDQHGIEVSNGFITSQESLFQVMPQDPHLKPLEKYPPATRMGMKLMFDLDFTNLATKLQGSFDPIEFYARSGEYIWQMTALEEMGYDVVKLKHKFDILNEISKKGKAVRDGIEETRGKFRVSEAEASVGKKRANELETELQQLKDDLKCENEEIEAIKLVEKELSQEEADTTNAIISVARAPWE